MKKKIIIHVSHTEISRDARILKEIKSIKNSFKDYKVFALGIKTNKNNSINNKNIIKNSIDFNLLSKKIFFLPTIIRKILNFL